ncbi:MAG: sigma-70 family RNA polymerase sigma factor [Alistipes sp.]|nr:sigma-70 family RNA polymerase sigma factor [Alistipes sp.]MBQ3209546.1 sigma-70 family RNA polymerase sigma factor [Alistipes sp.]MBQ9962095.1 sigma-70 family RNA polymerase sigma factor [Alistipes sp.]
MDRDISQIIEALRSSECGTGAFDAIIERYSERLYWHIRRILVQHEASEDALQETFVKAFLAAKSFRGDSEGSLVAWLYKIATTEAIRSLRRRKRYIFTSIDSLSHQLVADFEGEIAPDADQITVRLQRAVLALPMKQKLVFNMRYFDEMSFNDISQITGQSVATLKTNYHYAVKRVKQSVEELEYE